MVFDMQEIWEQLNRWCQLRAPHKVSVRLSVEVISRLDRDGLIHFHDDSHKAVGGRVQLPTQAPLHRAP